MRRAIKFGVPALLILLAIVYALISFLMASGVTKADRKALTTTPAAFGMEYEDVEFPPRDDTDGITLRGWFIPAENSGQAILFVHGINSNREEGEDFLNLASRLVGNGFNVLLFDLRAHGESDGEQVSGGLRERQDVLGAFDFLISRGIESDEIGVLAFSMGAATALQTAAQEPRITALVADSPFADVADMVAQETARTTIFPRWLVPVFIPGMKLFANVIYDIDIGEIVPEDAVKQLDYPIFVIHGLADTRIATEQGIRVHEAAHPDSELWLVPEVDHVDAFREHPDEYEQ
ncbi:MAG: alpha/beta hydrolase, partial [Ardenticatenaceae bacterium]